MYLLIIIFLFQLFFYCYYFIRFFAICKPVLKCALSTSKLPQELRVHLKLKHIMTRHQGYKSFFKLNSAEHEI